MSKFTIYLLCVFAILVALMGHSEISVLVATLLALRYLKNQFGIRKVLLGIVSFIGLLIIIGIVRFSLNLIVKVNPWLLLVPLGFFVIIIGKFSPSLFWGIFDAIEKIFETIGTILFKIAIIVFVVYGIFLVIKSLGILGFIVLCVFTLVMLGFRFLLVSVLAGLFGGSSGESGYSGTSTGSTVQGGDGGNAENMKGNKLN